MALVFGFSVVGAGIGDVDRMLTEYRHVFPGVLAAAVLYAIYGVGLGALLKNQVVAIVVGLGVTAILEPIIVAVVPSVGRWLPGQVAQALESVTANANGLQQRHHPPGAVVAGRPGPTRLRHRPGRSRGIHDAALGRHLDDGMRSRSDNVEARCQPRDEGRVERRRRSRLGQGVGALRPRPARLSPSPHVRRDLIRFSPSGVVIDPVEEPYVAGPDGDDAFEFLRTTGISRGLTGDLDDAHKARALEALRATCESHDTGTGVVFGSAGWVISARRPGRTLRSH